jgi:ATP-dependent DNA ligase
MRSISPWFGRYGGALSSKVDQPVLRYSSPRATGSFGSPLKLSCVHWVRPEVVVEVTYLTWTEDNLLRQVSYQGQREDKPTKQVVRPMPHSRY